MSLCSPSCGNSTEAPRFPAGCLFETRKGGIPNFIFLNCTARFAGDGETTVTLTDPNGVNFQVGKITDSTSWAALVQHGMARLSPEGIGEKPESTYTTQRLSSCRPEEIASETHAINLQSFQMDEDNFYDHTYWKKVRTNYSKYRVVYWDCAKNLYYSGDVEDPGFEFSPTRLGYTIPNNNNENAFYQANLSFIHEGDPTPIFIPGLPEALTIDVNT